MKVGEIIPMDREITLNEGKALCHPDGHKYRRPSGTGRLPLSFFEVNRCLSFDREKAYGFHLDIPSGTSVRFEPGEEKEVQLTAIGGTGRVFGFNDLTCAKVSERTLPLPWNVRNKKALWTEKGRKKLYEHKNIRRKICNDVRPHNR